MSRGNVIRLPSDKETKRAEDNNQKAFFPRVGRYFTSKSGKIMVTLDVFADTCFMLSEDKPKDDGVDQTGSVEL